MSLSQEFIYRAGQIENYIEDVKKAGVTHLIMMNGNFATRYPEMLNTIVGGLQWGVDNHAVFTDSTFGIAISSDTDSLLAANPNEKLHPEYTKMNEVERVGFVLDAVRIQFPDIDSRAYLYDGSPDRADNGRDELNAIKASGLVPAVTTKAAPWNLPHPFGSPLWFAPEFEEYAMTVWNDPSQGSIMEKFDRAARIAAIGDTVTPEAVHTVTQLVLSGAVINLFDQDVVLLGKDGQPILDADGHPFVIKPEIGLHGGPYMEIAKPHLPLFPVEDAAKPYLG